MSVLTLFGFLLGRRDAIETVAETKSAVWLGLLFVFSAGLAREYDGEDLLSEPWHLGIPLVASLATSFLLFVLICVAGGLSRWNLRTFCGEYRRFLGLYWMTAPLAWLYAIPVERWMSPGDATATNLNLLGLVALWRVVLIIRVISVIYVYLARWFSAMFVVMLFADTVLLTLLFHTPLPVVSFMGGVRLTESEAIISATSRSVGLLGMLSLPIWLIGSAAVIWNKVFEPYQVRADREPPAVSISAWALGIVALLVWIPILPRTQPEQQLRHSVEQDLRSGRIEQALTTMSEHERADFPPHWDPPPRVGYGENTPPLLDVLEVVIENGTTGWVREEFERKFEDLLGDGYFSSHFWIEVENEEFGRYLNVMEQLPLSQEALDEHRDALRSHVSFSEEVQRTEKQIARLHQLLGMPYEAESSDDPEIELENGPDRQP